jgi:hypothetical protein
MKLNFSPLTVYNTWTICNSADGGGKRFKTKDWKKFGARGQVATRGLNFGSADSNG